MMNGQSWKIGWQGRAEGPGGPRMDGEISWAGGRKGPWAHPLHVPSPTLWNPLWLFSALWCRPGIIGKCGHSQSSVASGSLAIQKMEFSQWNVLSFLNSHIELFLSICSTFLDSDHNLTIVCGLWLLLLFLCFLVGIPSLPTFWKTKIYQKVRIPGQATNRDFLLLFPFLVPHF